MKVGNMRRFWGLGLALTLAVAGPVGSAETPLVVSTAPAVIEQAPVLLARLKLYKGPTAYVPGGIPALYGEGGAAQKADVATHADTQALRNSVAHPDLRIIMTVTEGHYRIVARKSHGIAKLADLKGKTIGTLTQTSAAYHVNRMLATVGLTEADVKVVRVPIAEMPETLAKGAIDAVAIWEPEISLAQKAIGVDAIAFSDDRAYRELFNLNTTEGALKDPVRRAKIVRFVRAVIDASGQIKKNPSEVLPLMVEQTKHSAEDIALGMKTHDYPGAPVPDLLDVLVAEEQWVAKDEKRAPRGRAELAKLIDRSVVAEAKKLP
jgi:NitT/TauT family transport system substrate-binding protein